jgi:enolase-phosphatase E1
MNSVQHPPPVILVDIEGTVGSIAFVRTVLFPYARRQLPVWMKEHGQEPETRRWLDAVASELGPSAGDEQVLAQLLQWIDEDRKHTALKALQGLLWRDGYLRGEYQAHLYPDAVAALSTWRQQGHPLFVYSSGSVAAQQLFFAHTVAGNLLPLFDGFFDTEVGGKREVQSYQRIAQRIGERTGNAATEILFLSDVIEELDAARKAQFQTVLVDRREDYPAPRVDGHGHRRVVSFLEIVI